MPRWLVVGSRLFLIVGVIVGILADVLFNSLRVIQWVLLIWIGYTAIIMVADLLTWHKR